MSSVQTQKVNPDLSVSFEDVSKLFSLPLSEAADILGVSTSALKKICNENGLERWPNRKYLAGKSIEDIKKEAAKEKSKVLGGTSPADNQKSNVTASSVVFSPGSHFKDKTLRPAAEISKLQSIPQHPGSRSVYTWRPPHLFTSGMAIETSGCLDEFKFGFPSNGLSRSTSKWWGSASDDQDKAPMDDLKTRPEIKLASELHMADTAVPVCADEKADSTMENSDCHVQDNVSLSFVRKRAVDEGRHALKLGVLKKYRTDKLGEEEKILFRQLFQMSFPMDNSAGILLSDANKIENLKV